MDIPGRLACAFLAALAATALASTVLTADDAASNFHGAVSAATPEAAQAGREILEAGGNAVDAAVAVAFALGVTEPAGSGLAGQSSFIVHPRRRRPFAINGTSFSPRATPTDAVAGDIVGHRATTVPSTVRVLEYAWKHFGSGKVPWERLLAPSIRYAEEGFVPGGFRHRSLLRYAGELRAQPSGARIHLQPDGSAPPAGSVFRQPALAQTLKRLAEAGAGDFYHGEIAREIARDMKIHGGWITLEDLENVPEPPILPALHTTYRDWDVYTLPPPAGGWAVLQILNILEMAPPQHMSLEHTRVLWLAEALRVGHRSRRGETFPDLTDYFGAVTEATSKKRARELVRTFDRPGGGETTHFSVVDRHGTAVGVTQSLNSYFGSRAAAANLGFLYNDYMKEFEVGRPGHPYAIRPQAMPYSSMSATILSRRGEVGLVLGSPGSARIISAVVQVVSNWVDLRRGIVEAVAAPRIHVVPEDALYVESKALPGKTMTELTRRGFRLVEPQFGIAEGNLDPYYGGVHAIAREREVWRGAADPRRDGAVAYASR